MQSRVAKISATYLRSGAGDEIGGEALLDVARDHLGGTVLGIAQAARPGETLLLAGDVIGHASEGRAGNDRFSGGGLDQGVGGVYPLVLHVGTRRGDIHNDGA